MSPDLYLIIDFEATCCDKRSIPRGQMEIIEIGAVMVEAQELQIIDEFQSFVRPVRHPNLTPFCTKLTSIQQIDVDDAPLFDEFICSFKAWLYQYHGFIFCSWGDYDRKQLHQDCDFHKVPYPITAPHLNLKRLITERQQLGKKLGLGEAVKMAGLKFIGTHHRGIDDARNIVQLLPYIFGEKILSSHK
ncbi:3'-5' exonuclease [Pseudanabaena sp. UWO310]|uniref:3'-5' exonuclease n=1 Tax=Pseudanabaena sp. UWO310 TaxID=2480795 RepID=UPI00116051D1|nr:3'-5' exonuclease [Pseudanabaena sp. UWO310]TYQ24525.1 exonuclease domain-containing protein [Pseudanabaena sp. UWO310]